MITSKAVIPAAGLGTRLLSATKEQPKEMLPVFSRGLNGELCVKPIVQLVFEGLYHAGLRDFCFVVGRGKRALEDHFTPDLTFIDKLDAKGKNSFAKDLESFYLMVEGSTIVWVNQPEPRGFGDAVLKAKSFVGDDHFLVHAGDSHFLSAEYSHLRKLLESSDKLGADALFLVQEIMDPRPYGVIDCETFEKNLLRVKHAVEKPQNPSSKLCIMPVYLFSPAIMKALERTKPGYGGELQLTDGIQTMISDGLGVYAMQIDESVIRLDIGSPDKYWEAQSQSYRESRRLKVNRTIGAAKDT